MPEMHFHLRWPDNSQMRCYSPSLVIKDHFTPGHRYPLPVFMAQMRLALHTASDRVHAKHGFACSTALDQLAQIEATAARFSASSEVEMLAFDDAIPASHPGTPRDSQAAPPAKVEAHRTKGHQ